MAERTLRRLGDCSHLPFSRAEGAKLRGRAVAEGIRSAHDEPWAMPEVAPPKVKLFEPVNYDPDDPTSVELRLLGRTILGWPIQLPETDPRGVLSADRFECWKKASDSRIGIAGYYYSFKGMGQVACHSRLEARLLRYFEMCPFVVEIRTQYPQWNRADFLAYCRAGCRFPEIKLRTIDFMLRLCIPGLPYHVYHGVSAKPAAKTGDAAVKRRHRKEADGLWEWGGTHEVMTEEDVNEREARNYERMLTYMRDASSEDIQRLARPAAVLASALKTTTAKGSLTRVVEMVGRRLGLDSANAFRLLGIAFFLGHLSWDHEYAFHPLEPMHLVS